MSIVPEGERKNKSRGVIHNDKSGSHYKIFKQREGTNKQATNIERILLLRGENTTNGRNGLDKL